MFDERNLKFELSKNVISSKFIGNLEFNNFELSYLRNTSDINQIDLKQHLNGARVSNDEILKNFSFNLLENRNIFVAYVCRNNFNMAILDRNGNRMSFKEQICSSSALEDIVSINSCTEKNMIFLVTLEAKFDEIEVKIRLIDQNLTFHVKSFLSFLPFLSFDFSRGPYFFESNSFFHLHTKIWLTT